MSRSFPPSKAARIGSGVRVAVIAAEFNPQITDELLGGCVERLAELGLGPKQVRIERVPGSFELPVAAKLAGQSGKFAAIICLGAVIRGQTAHFDLVAGQAARGIGQVGIELAIPVIFGVLTTDNVAQARQRLGGRHGHAGKRAAEAAVQMIGVRQRLSGKSR